MVFKVERIFEEFTAKTSHQVCTVVPIGRISRKQIQRFYLAFSTFLPLICVDEQWWFWKETLHLWMDNRLVCACVAACCLLIKARARATNDGFRVMFSEITEGLRSFPGSSLEDLWEEQEEY